MGKLQNEDFKTLAELTGAGGSANQLLNDTKVYVTANSINKTLSQAIIDNDIGGGGGGGGNIFSGNTNLSGAYYGDVIVYGGNVTITGNLIVHGNLIVDGSVSCTGDFSIDIKNDVYIKTQFNYSPASGGQDITIGGDLTVLGEDITTVTTYGPFDIINVNPYPGGFGFTEVTTTGYPFTGGATLFELTPTSPNYPYSVQAAASMIDFYAPGTTTIFLDTQGNPCPVTTLDEWQTSETSTEYYDILISQKADRSLKIRGNLKCRKLVGKSLSPATRSLNIFIGGNVDYSASISGFVVNPIIDISSPSGDTTLGSGTIEVKGCVSSFSIYANAGYSSTAPGTCGEIRLGAWMSGSTAILQANGGIASGNVALVNGTPGGNVYINGFASGSSIDVVGGGSSGSGGGNGANGGSINIKGFCEVGYINSYGGSSGTLGNGGGGGSISIYGTHSGAINNFGGSGIGATKYGGNGGSITLYGDHVIGPISSYGGSGTSNARGGNGGSLTAQGNFLNSIYSNSVQSYGGSGNGSGVGGAGGNLYFLNSVSVSSISNAGGSSTGGTANGGNAGNIFFYGFATVGTINSSGGLSAGGTAGAATVVNIYGGGNITQISMNDGTVGVVPTSTVTLTIGGTVIVQSINVPNRANATIRGNGSYNGAALLRVRGLSGKDVFVSSSNTNPTASQAALCADRLYSYNNSSLRWQYSALTNA